jgi:hypothetical protein
MLLAGLRRIAIGYAAVLGLTVAVSALLGAAAGASLGRSLSVGLYVVGAVFMVGCFVFGVKGPLRGSSDSGEAAPLVGARNVRRASPDERSEATRVSLILFGLGLSFIVLGSLFDPVHSTF